MPKQSYGVVPQGRSQLLLFALLDFANDSLPGDEATLGRLRTQVELHWQTATRLVVRTKLRYLQSLCGLASPGQSLTLPQIKTALKHCADYLGILEDNRTMTRGSEDWHFTLHFWGDRWEREYNLTCFYQAWTEQGKVSPPRHNGQRLLSLEGDRQDINWHEIFRNTLNVHLTSNPLTAGDGMVFQLEELYVPLGVIKHPSIQEETQNESESKSYQPKDLLAKALQNMTDTQTQSRLAIIGEPGAGKSTFLQQFSLTLITNNTAFPLWISLADLEGRSLEEFLTTTWLKRAFKTFTIAPEIINQFTQLIESGRVWILLDALDEMDGQLSLNSIKIERELQGWLGHAPVILSCRSGIWETAKNALNFFEFYHCQGFNTDQLSGLNQIEIFIQQWFKRRKNLGDRLVRELERNVNRRIYQLTKHPLYLVLLCRTWQLTQGKLPGTKAMLYQQFIDGFYNWKQEAFPTTRSQRRSLNNALGNLALQGMKKTPSSFRFREGEIQAYFDHVNPDLLTLALQLGWLLTVGHSETTGEKIYSFYHPTFQEYFAAVAIAKGQDLICLSNPNTNKDENHVIYPIFLSHWQEIILLWLGRTDLEVQEKEFFLQQLWHWQDNCGGFYTFKAHCLVGKCLAEFPSFSQAETVIQELIQWRFMTPQNGVSLPAPMVEQAGIALSRSDRHLTIPALERFLQQTDHPFDQWLAAHSLGKNHDFGNRMAIAVLEKLLNMSLDINFKLNICRSLSLIDPHNPLLLSTLKKIINTEVKINIRRKTALRLGKLLPNNRLAINTLESLLQESQDPQQRGHILDSLQELVPNHPLLLNRYNRPGKTIKPYKLRQKSPQEQQHASQTILNKLTTNLPNHKRIYLLAKLAIYDPSQPVLLPSLLTALATEHQKSSLKLIGDTLDLLISREGDRLTKILPEVRDLYTSPRTHAPGKRACYKLLWDWSTHLTYTEFQHLWQCTNGLSIQDSGHNTENLETPSTTL